LAELTGAITALEGSQYPAAATAGYTSSLHEALRAGTAPSSHMSVHLQGAAHRAGSLVNMLEKSEENDLSRAQKIEHEIERLKGVRVGQRSKAKHTNARTGELSNFAAEEKRANAVLSSLRLQEETENPMMMLNTENCAQTAQQFDKNLTTLPMIETDDKCTLPNVWDAGNKECVQSPLGEGDKPIDCIIKGPQSCVCKNWQEAHIEKVENYRKLLRDNFAFRYEHEFGSDGYAGSYRKGLLSGGRRHALTKWGKPIPQRFPHKSGADLGDNWISGFSDRHSGGYGILEEDLQDGLEDHMASSTEPRARTPVGLRPFVLGGQADAGRWSQNPTRYHHLSYFRGLPMTAAEHELLSGNSTESYEARKFADNNFAFGAESPLNETSLNMVWGTGHRYLSDRYGALVDVYPSTKQLMKQLVQPTLHEVWLKRMQDKQFPRVTKLVQRWRNNCPGCELRAVLEKSTKMCKAPDCQSRAPVEPTPPEHVKVCNPAAGCYFVKGPKLRSRDALKDQVLKGQEAGMADPLGLYGELGDHRVPASLVLGARHEDHNYGEKWGEPISDFLMSNWDVHSGLANEHDTTAIERDQPLEFPRYYPHTKGVSSGPKAEADEEVSEDGDEEEPAE